MKPRVLVAAASGHNGTRDIAEAIAAGLAERGVLAEVRDVDDVADLSDYGAVVLGSAIYMNRWLAEARRFVQIHVSELCMTPVWLFSSGPLGPADHLIPPSVPADVPVLLRLTRARGHRRFGGRLEMRVLRFDERALVRTIHAPEEDRRDWAAIDRFAGEIAEDLQHNLQRCPNWLARPHRLELCGDDGGWRAPIPGGGRAVPGAHRPRGDPSILCAR